MTPAANPAAVPLSRTLDVETPELVVLTYTLAGIGSRAFAAIIDYLICFAALFLGGVGLGVLGASVRGLGGRVTTAWVLTVFVLAQFAVLWGYYVLFEALADGQTPGKRLLRLRVVRDGGYSITFGASAVRNLLRLVDLQPVFTYAVGMVSVLLSRSGKRLGDYAAGTIVVRENVTRSPTPGVSDVADADLPTLHTRLREDEYAVLERFMEPRSEIAADRRRALADQLGQRFAMALAELPPDADQTDLARLSRLLDAERAARRAGLPGRDETGAARERHAIIAAGTPRWAAFAARLSE
ncbi:MAG: RDD family protein, partial [Gemmatimonadaceae bacterium]